VHGFWTDPFDGVSSRARQALPYYAFIDGLRAVAVLLVVLFHLELAFPGGFIGVDVFFVISGFLITSLIMRDYEAGDFSMLVFWQRRARRILPALLLVVLAAVVAGWFLLLPRDLMELGWSVLAQAAFLQNVVFWSGEGYFAAPSETKPLLHTWSLAVEEQFYVVFPVFLALLGWRARRIWPFVLALLLLVSLAISVFAVKFFPGAAFYFLPSRAWELLLGAMIAVVPPPRGFPHILKEIATALALAILLVAAAVYSAETPFPGWAALPPCVATATIIWLNQTDRTAAARLLEWPLLVFIGLISYSLYLWHWPLISYYRYWQLEPMSMGVKLLLLLASVVLAVLSWKFVETPFRRGIGWSSRKIFTFSASGLSACAMVGASLMGNDGWVGRFTDEVIGYDAVAREETYRNEMDTAALSASRWIELGAARENSETVDVVVWGDSLAMALCPAVDDYCQQHGLSGIAITRSATAPLPGFANQRALSDPHVSAAALEVIQKKEPKIVILAAAWSGYAQKDPKVFGSQRRDDFWSALAKTVDILRRPGRQIWIVLEPPIHRHHVPRVLARNHLFGLSYGKSVITPLDYSAASSDFHQRLADHVGEEVKVIEPADAFLASGQGKNAPFLVTDQSGKAAYRDHIHLSTHGARMVGKLFPEP